MTLTITYGWLAKIDELAAEFGQARATVISVAFYPAAEHGVMINNLHE